MHNYSIFFPVSQVNRWSLTSQWNILYSGGTGPSLFRLFVFPPSSSVRLSEYRFDIAVVESIITIYCETMNTVVYKLAHGKVVAKGGKYLVLKNFMFGRSELKFLRACTAHSDYGYRSDYPFLAQYTQLSSFQEPFWSGGGGRHSPLANFELVSQICAILCYI